MGKWAARFRRILLLGPEVSSTAETTSNLSTKTKTLTPKYGNQIINNCSFRAKPQRPMQPTISLCITAKSQLFRRLQAKPQETFLLPGLLPNMLGSVMKRWVHKTIWVTKRWCRGGVRHSGCCHLKPLVRATYPWTSPQKTPWWTFVRSDKWILLPYQAYIRTKGNHRQEGSWWCQMTKISRPLARESLASPSRLSRSWRKFKRIR